MRSSNGRRAVEHRRPRELHAAANLPRARRRRPAAPRETPRSRSARAAQARLEPRERCRPRRRASSAVSAVGQPPRLSRARSAAMRARSTVRSPRHAASSSQAVRDPACPRTVRARSRTAFAAHGSGTPQANACRAPETRVRSAVCGERPARTSRPSVGARFEPGSRPQRRRTRQRGSRAGTRTRGSGSRGPPRPAAEALRRATACGHGARHEGRARRSVPPEARSARRPVGRQRLAASTGANRRSSRACSSEARPSAPDGRAAGVIEANDVGRAATARPVMRAAGAATARRIPAPATGDAGSVSESASHQPRRTRRARPPATAPRHRARAPATTAPRTLERHERIAPSDGPALHEPGKRLARDRRRHEVGNVPGVASKRGRRDPPPGRVGSRIRQCAVRCRAPLRSLADSAPHEQRALRPTDTMPAPVAEELPRGRATHEERRRRARAERARPPSASARRRRVGGGRRLGTSSRGREPRRPATVRRAQAHGGAQGTSAAWSSM